MKNQTSTTTAVNKEISHITWETLFKKLKGKKNKAKAEQTWKKLTESSVDTVMQNGQKDFVRFISLGRDWGQYTFIALGKLLLGIQLVASFTNVPF